MSGILTKFSFFFNEYLLRIHFSSLSIQRRFRVLLYPYLKKDFSKYSYFFIAPWSLLQTTRKLLDYTTHYEIYIYIYMITQSQYVI